MPRTALIVAVPEAEAAVSTLRLQYDRSAALGVPAHLTILFPFVDSAAIDENAVEGVVASHDAFDFELVSVETFDGGGTYLAPTHPERFVALTESVWRRWPDHPPYEGTFETIVPHLTISDHPLECELDLPIAARADAVTLIEEQADGRWLSRRRFALRSGSSAPPGTR
jgi:2'-5' RNA ligase superfamily